MQNIEFKSELRDLQAARRQCHLLQAQRMAVLRQVDTYFKLADGRLKRREITGVAGTGQKIPAATEWVFYHRPNRLAPRMSNYTILTDDQARRRWGTHSLRPWVKVVKKREIWTCWEVRIHLDDVEGLGTFIEFEAPVTRGFDVKQCHAAIDQLRESFAPVLGEPISDSYSDLMEQIVAEKAK